MCSSRGYKCIPYVHALISMIEAILGIPRIIIFFGDKPSNPHDLFSNKPANAIRYIPSPLLSSTQAKVAFTFDWLASIIPTFMGVYIALFILLAFCNLLVTCSCLLNAKKNTRDDVEGCWDCCKLMCRMCKSKANHRCVSLTCNCPCYTARPQLRFHVRFALLTSFIFLRILAIILYASDQTITVYGGYMAALCTISILFTILMLSIDFYQYRVWWYYRPDGAYKKCRCCCCKQHFHGSHRRFLPAPLLGTQRQDDQLGNRPCKYTISGTCSNLSLEHIVSFHAFDFKPLRRYSSRIGRIYIGFHQTKPKDAVGIAKTGFRISDTPPQMLGFGVYFARSCKDTGNKARHKGAYICAKISMGHVRVVRQSELHEVSNTNVWWKTHDTIYYAHEDETRDEFCVKNPKQILKWVIIVDDERMHRYGLDHEFDDTRCNCI